MSDAQEFLPLREALEGLIAQWKPDGHVTPSLNEEYSAGWYVAKHRLLADLEEILARFPVSPSLEGRWHPIETHPREPGTRFLVASHEGVREAVTDDPLWGRFSTLLVGPYIGWQPLPPAPTTKETP